MGVGASEHDGQQGCSARSQAVPYNDQPVFLKDRSRMRRGHKTKQRMMENERKEKGQSHRSDAEGLAENPVADEASVQVLGSLRNPLETEAAAMMAGQDRLCHDGRQGALHLLVTVPSARAASRAEAVPTALVFLAPGVEVGDIRSLLPYQWVFLWHFLWLHSVLPCGCTSLVWSSSCGWSDLHHE